MFKLTVVATASARLFAPAPPPAVYSAPEAQMAPMVMPAAYATAEEGAGAGSWVLPSVAMLGIGGLFGYFATSKTSEGSELPMSRRDVLGAGAALAAFAPMAAFAD